jgi:hypothetical protein
VWLKSYQRVGYFPKLVEVPEVFSAHVRGVLGLGDDVVLEQDAEQQRSGIGSSSGTGWA